MNFQSCDFGQMIMLRNRHRDAVTWVSTAYQQIVAYQAYATIRSVSSLPPTSPVRRVHDALLANFRSVAASDVRRIAEAFRVLDQAMQRSRTLTYECAPVVTLNPQTNRFRIVCRPNEAAFVSRTSTLTWDPVVHVCPAWFACRSEAKQTTDLIHERAHQALRCGDVAYEHEAGYATMRFAEAMQNAESFAVAARQIVNGTAFGPGVTCRNSAAAGSSP